MIEYAVIYDDVYDILAPLLDGTPLIRDTQSDMRPAERYATYRISKLQSIGFNQQYATNTSGTYNLIQTYSLTLRLSVIGSEIAGLAAKWHMRVTRPTVLDAFEAAGLHYYDRTEIKDVPRFVSTGYEDRSTFDVSFYIRVEDEYAPGWIEFVELTEKILRENNTVVVEQTTTIDLTP